MAIDFYKLGRQSGATTPKNQQSGFEAFVGGATKPLETMLANSQAATAALTAAMPSGVAIEKVPEQLRSQVSQYLTNNKKAYTDAAKVVASGINPQSQRYKEAIEVMNSVNTKFENLSNNLESIAVARKNALDDPSYSAMTTDEDGLIYSNLANGSLYNTMSINDDGTFNYKDAEGATKLFNDFKVEKQGFTGQQAFLGLVEDAQKQAGIKGMTFDTLQGKYQTTINTLFDKLGPRGSLDYAFADKDFTTEYLNRKENKGVELNDLKKNPGNFVEEYKAYNMTKLRESYDAAPKYSEGFKGTAAYYNYLDTKSKIQNEIDDLNKFESGKAQEGYPIKDREISTVAIDRVVNYLNKKGGGYEFLQKKDPDTGGYSYYVKRTATDKDGNVIDIDLKIQDALTKDLEMVPLNIENIEQILKEAGTLPRY